MSSLPQPKRWVVVCCPVSGKKDAVQVLERDFFPKAKELGLDVKMVLTERAGHATELAAEHGSPETGLVLVGGDGTIHEAMYVSLESLASKQLSKPRLHLLRPKPENVDTMNMKTKRRLDPTNRTGTGSSRPTCSARWSSGSCRRAP